MRFSSVVTLCLAGLAVARPVVYSPQDLPTFTKAMNAIQDAVTVLGETVAGLTDTTDSKVVAPKLVDNSKKILDALVTGAKAISASTELSLVDATGLISPSSAMTKKVVAVIDELISKKALIAKAGQTKVVLDSFNDQKAATKAFIDAIQSKVPSLAKSIAASQAKPAVDALEKGIKEFS